MDYQNHSIRSVRRMRKKQPKLIQGCKKILIIRGNKSSNSVMKLLKNMKSLRKQRTILYSEKHNIQPYENKEQIENYCKKAEAQLFMFGSHSKKRPNNIVIGRIYEHKILDMVELGINTMQAMQDIVDNITIPINVHPFIIFQGDLWETDDNFKELRNIFNDFFYANERVQGIELPNLFNVCICISVLEDKRIWLRTYQIRISGDIIGKDCNISMAQLGPNVQFCVRRSSLADPDVWKKATYVPKPKKKKHNKNIKYDSVGNKKGRIYLDRQNIEQFPQRKTKLISKNKPKIQKIQRNEVNNMEFLN